MVEVTSFNVLPDSQILDVPGLIDSNNHICIVDIHNIDVINWCILDNVGGRRLAWKRSTLQCKSCRFVCQFLHCHLQWGSGLLVSLVVVTLVGGRGSCFLAWCRIVWSGWSCYWWKGFSRGWILIWMQWNTCCNPSPSILMNILLASTSCLSASLLSFCAVIDKCRIVIVLEYKLLCGNSIAMRSS